MVKLPCPKSVCPGIRKAMSLSTPVFAAISGTFRHSISGAARSFPILIKWKIVCAAGNLTANALFLNRNTRSPFQLRCAPLFRVYFRRRKMHTRRRIFSEWRFGPGWTNGSTFFFVERFLLGCLVLECLAVIRTCVELEILAYLFLARHSYSPASLGITE